MSYTLTKSSKQKFKRAQPLLGTFVQIELQGDADEKLLSECISKGFEAISEIDRLMSFHRLDSDLTRLNQSQPSTWVKVFPLTIQVLNMANELFQNSKGIFDIRCGAPLVDWGLLPALNKRENDGTFDLGLPVEIDGMNVRKTGPWILDLGGIAKGFAVDRAVEAIQELSAKHSLSGIVNAGGDLRVFGDYDPAIALRIHGQKQDWIKSIDLKNLAVATSSVRPFLRSKEWGNISAYVKMPSRNAFTDQETVTVFAETCLIADALTKVVLLGEKALARECLKFYKAKAFVFEMNGQLKEFF